MRRKWVLVVVGLVVVVLGICVLNILDIGGWIKTANKYLDEGKIQDAKKLLDKCRDSWFYRDAYQQALQRIDKVKQSVAKLKESESALYNAFLALLPLPEFPSKLGDVSLCRPLFIIKDWGGATGYLVHPDFFNLPMEMRATDPQQSYLLLIVCEEDIIVGEYGYTGIRAVQTNATVDVLSVPEKEWIGTFGVEGPPPSPEISSKEWKGRVVSMSSGSYDLVGMIRKRWQSKPAK